MAQQPDLEAAREPLLAADAADGSPGGSSSGDGGGCGPPGSSGSDGGGAYAAITHLAGFKKTTSQLQELQNCRVRPAGRRAAVHSYYLAQNELIDALLQTEQLHRGLFTNDEAAVRRRVLV